MRSINIEDWIGNYINVVKHAFEKRIWFIGLQGSWGRGEATNSSDIDIVFIMDTVSMEDLRQYDRLLQTLPYRDKICGFMAGKIEIENWDKSDLFQFCNDTIALYGSLDSLLSSIRRTDIRRAVKIGACNVYHGCVHNIVHDKSKTNLLNLYKSASFTLRASAYLEKGYFAKKQEALFPILSPEDQKILKQKDLLKQCKCITEDLFLQSSNLLLQWASRWIEKM